MMRDQASLWNIWIDTGGTFTDCIATDPEGQKRTTKVLSSSALRGKVEERLSATKYRVAQEWEAPNDLVKGFTFISLDGSGYEAEVTAFDSNQSIIKLNKPVDVAEGSSFEVQSDEEAPVLAARLVTGTPRNQKLPPIKLRLATTKATNALLEKKGSPTAHFVTKGFGDLLEIGTQQRPDLFSLEIQKRSPIYEEVVEVEERLDAEGNVLQVLNQPVLKAKVQDLLQEGITTAAVSLMHSYQNPEHEQQLQEWLLQQGFQHVSISSELSPFIGILTRTETTLVNAYLAPTIQQYLDEVQNVINDQQMYVMSSAGGLSQRHQFEPKDSLLSGPAGGVVGAASAGKGCGYDRIISFDMGGTSSDVARFDSDYEYVFEHTIGEAHLAAPALHIETVAAGGGSICYFDGYKLCVGPESAGAWPGPACYGAGGPLTITDVNLLLGRLDPENFHIPVDKNAANDRLEEVQQSVNSSDNQSLSKQELLDGFLQIANERMAEAIRKISVQKGYNTRNYALVAFGGAGGQHACAIADRLNMQSVLVPSNAGLLSAHGIGQANIEEFAEQQILQPLPEVSTHISSLLERLASEAIGALEDSIAADDITIRRQIASMRLAGQETALDIEYNKDTDLRKAFKAAYREQYGHWVSDREIEVVSLRVVASTIQKHRVNSQQFEDAAPPESVFEKEVGFGGQRLSTPVYHRSELAVGHTVIGPAIVLDPHSTIVVEPQWKLKVTNDGALKMEKKKKVGDSSSEEISEVVNLELFTNRFTAIAEEMGEMLQRTALSVNVRDRLDFSCALLNARGQLVVNAPHIPVHLGALGLCVRKLQDHISMESGDVVVTNHPGYGGSHLPDVTVVTPIFVEDTLVGFSASRAHHAEIGGAAPGSMPPTATNLQQEGVVIPPMYLVKNGEQRWDEIESHLLSGKYPTRNVEENMADLQAAVAANKRGMDSLQKLCQVHGIEKVQHYMDALCKHAEEKMRATIQTIEAGTYSSEQLLDDGTPIKVEMEVTDDFISMNFEGTGDVHPGNLNATPAIVNSVIMYVARLLIDEPIPLNGGLLEPIDITLPKCLLNPDFNAEPSDCPAVVGGNTEVSQRVVDTLLKPFERIACSQGTMNNILFGNDSFGYYETVGGGTGAGPAFDGADAVHHHMTNTRGTDPEILENRYPVRLDEYAIRLQSGGTGVYNGGDGIRRKMTFLDNVDLTVLTQHRNSGPYGIKGGNPGNPGSQRVIFGDGHSKELDAIDGCSLKAGDQFILETPGGGGYGTK